MNLSRSTASAMVALWLLGCGGIEQEPPSLSTSGKGDGLGQAYLRVQVLCSGIQTGGAMVPTRGAYVLAYNEDHRTTERVVTDRNGEALLQLPMDSSRVIAGWWDGGPDDEPSLLDVIRWNLGEPTGRAWLIKHWPVVLGPDYDSPETATHLTFRFRDLDWCDYP